MTRTLGANAINQLNIINEAVLGERRWREGPALKARMHTPQSRPWSAPAYRGAAHHIRWRPITGSTSTFGNIARSFGKILINRNAANNQGVRDTQLSELGAQFLCFRGLQRCIVNNDQRAIFNFGRERMSECQLADLLWQVMRMTANARSVSDTATNKDRRIT